ncbi:MAG: glycine betaine/proline transport system substrate-binding protein [Rhodospirillaceae bacterium]|nr:glycine betaine/proline transport system substrate-binding protein [Rhodospirillaceae bacterium]
MQISTSSTTGALRRKGAGMAAVAAVATFIASGFAAQAADLGAKDEPLKLAMVEWTGAHISTHIAGQLLEKMGYKVEYVTAGAFPVFSGLADGSVSLSVENWMNNVGDIYPKVLKEKKIEDLGPLKLETQEGWIYPKYMEEICPGLPDWSALTKPACVQALAVPDTFPKGRLLDYPAEWGSRSAQIIKDNDLPFASVPAGSEGALVSELEGATAAKKPLLMMFWGPHYALAEADVAWIKMPPCKVNDNAHCINPPDVNKIVWSGFGKKWPAAYEFLKHFEVHAKDQQQMILQVDKKGDNLDKVAKEWIDQHESVWQPWVKAGQS